MAGSPGSSERGATDGGADKDLRIGGWVSPPSGPDGVPLNRPRADGPAAGDHCATCADLAAGAGGTAAAGSLAGPATRDPLPVTFDPLLDPLTVPLDRRWWERPAVARSGVVVGVVATVLLTFLLLPESPGGPDRTARPAPPPPIDSGISIVAEKTSAPPGESPTLAASPSSARSSGPVRAAPSRRPVAGGGDRASTTPPRPANPPTTRPPTPSGSPSAPRPGELVPQSPSREGGLRSVNSDRPTAIDFVNTRSQQVIVYWLDYRGRRVRYRSLAPGASYRQPTYVTHPWLITTTDGRGLVIFLPDRNPARATIR